jgi:hypothetical protein
VYERPYYNALSFETNKEVVANTLEYIGIVNNFLSNGLAFKRKNEQMGLHQTKKLLHKNTNIHSVTAHRMAVIHTITD